MVTLLMALTPAWSATTTTTTTAATSASTSASAPSQLPLINRADTKPRTNVMLTLDDSGSMTYQYLPERPFQLNGQTVNFPNDAKVFLNPREPRDNEFTGSGDWSDAFYVTAVPNVQSSGLSDAMKLIQVQMRSPQVNGMYYNPEVRYLPWTTSDGRSYRTPDPTHAWLHPSDLDPDQPAPDPSANSDWVDLTQNTAPDVYWYCSTDVGAPNYNSGTCYTKYSPTLTYSPALLYLLASGADPNQVGNYTEINLNTINGSVVYTIVPPPGTQNQRTDCNTSGTTVTCNKAQELQNYTNWFVFYRSRLMAAKGAIPAAFASMADNLRVGWGTIHSGISYDQYGNPSSSLGSTPYYPDVNDDGTRVSSTTSPIVQQSVRPLTDQHKANLTKWMRKLLTYRGTPSKDALYAVGQYFQRTDAYGPWATDPSAGLPANTATQLGCRRNYNILITDGYYNTSYTTLPSAYANADNTATTGYTPGDPFADDSSNTLADFAMYFWSRDLRSDLSADSVPAAPACNLQDPDQQKRLACIKSDTASWRHLSQFMIGFGVSGTTVAQDSDKNDNSLWQLSNCHTSDPSISASNKLCWPSSVNEIDDLWHAAINTRGAYFSVKQADKLAPALMSALTTASDATASVAGAATSSSQLITNDNVAFVPEYQPVSWYGNVRAYTLDNQGNTGPEIWNAASQMPTPAKRNIFVWDSIAKAAYPFLYQDPKAATSSTSGTAMTPRSIGLLGATSADLVNYLRGENNSAWITFKPRSQPPVSSGPSPSFILPDFVNSTPLYVKQGTDLGYTQLPVAFGGGQLYTDYLNQKSSRTNSLLLVGSNGGMLHAFNMANTSTGFSPGTEIFALVPEAALPNMAKIAQTDYGSSDNYHQALVDGPLTESDAYFKAPAEGGAQWHDVVVGTMGAGGRSVFALTLNSADPTAGLSGGSVLWEATSADTGYISSEPQVGVTPDGVWRVFVGNGADSPNGRAALLMIDVASGTVQSIAVPTIVPASATPAQSHVGLGGVTLIRDGTGQVIGAYAGDMQGHVWRFEWDAKQGVMALGYSSQPLFQAVTANGTPQAITAAPLIVPHPTKKGELVIVNTGRLLYTDDSDDTTPQSAYGIWDQQNFASGSTLTLQPPTIGRGDLLGQTIDSAVDQLTTIKMNGQVITQTRTFYTLTSNPINWSINKGWVLDLVFPNSPTTIGGNAKAIFPPILTVGTMALVTGVIPAGNAESCVNDGSGAGIYVDLTTGGKRLTMLLDTNGDGTFDKKSDLANASGFRLLRAGRSIVTSSTTATGTKVFKCRVGVDGCAPGQDVPPTPQLTITDRVWRQLLNPPTP